MNLLINKFERVLGKDCIAFKMLASDTRRLDAAAKKWANAREFVTQAAQAIDDLKDIEKRAQLTKREAKQLLPLNFRIRRAPQSRDGMFRRVHQYA